jgi:hypothetical protein
MGYAISRQPLAAVISTNIPAKPPSAPLARLTSTNALVESDRNQLCSTCQGIAQALKMFSFDNPTSNRGTIRLDRRLRLRLFDDFEKRLNCEACQTIVEWLKTHGFP